jgi:PqqD family protein of HPr-rel-A system
MDVRASQFRVPPGADLQWRTWGDETVVYHGPSGDTHLLNPIAAEALRVLASQAAGVDDLAGRLADRVDAAERPDLAEHLSSLLANFAELGLIEPVDDDPRPHANPTG